MPDGTAPGPVVEIIKMRNALHDMRQAVASAVGKRELLLMFRDGLAAAFLDRAASESDQIFAAQMWRDAAEMARSFVPAAALQSMPPVPKRRWTDIIMRDVKGAR